METPREFLAFAWPSTRFCLQIECSAGHYRARTQQECDTQEIKNMELITKIKALLLALSLVAILFLSLIAAGNV